MGNSREWTSKFNARFRELSAFVKDGAGRSDKKRRGFIKKAAAGRRPDLSGLARQSVDAKRREDAVQRDINLIAGRP